MIERLRGVSYQNNSDGKRGIGLVAEEVAEIVPEVVTFEANGRDVTSVDYSRLSAVLIEAVKEQQRELRRLREDLVALKRQLEAAQ